MIPGVADRMAAKILENVQAYSGGEQIAAVALGATDQPRKRFWTAMISHFAVAFVERPRYVVMTDRTLLILKPAVTGLGRVDEVLVDQPLQAVDVVRYKRGLLRSLMVLRVDQPPQDVRLTFSRTWWSRVEEIRARLAA